MSAGPQVLLIGAVAAVGVLHTIVPDHWVPITLIARQRGWSNRETARASLQAGIGHVVSTLLIAAVVWLAGVAFATRFGHWVDTIASIALAGLQRVRLCVLERYGEVLSGAFIALVGIVFWIWPVL